MSVFAVHPVPEINLTPALIYGEINYINHRYIFADELNGDEIPESFLSKMEKVVDQFDFDQDYLLIAGDHLQIIYMSALLAARWGEFNALRYDRKAGGYVSVRVTTGETTHVN